MFARVTTFTGAPDDIEAAVATYREQALPWMLDATGFRGWIVLLDRAEGEALGLTFWADEAVLRNAVASGGALRDEIAREAGTPMRSMRAYEVLAVESVELG